ncbi:MAG: ABC transporter permease [Desulfovibrionaceae bacterium]
MGEERPAAMKRRGPVPWLMLAPLALPFVLLFGAGVGTAVLQSFGLLSPIPLETSPLEAYARLGEGPFWASFWFTVRVALGSALLSVSAGAVLAWWIWGLSSRLRFMGLAHKVPLILPHIAVAFIVLIIFSQSGVLASAAHQAGLIDAPAEFPAVLFAGNGAGLMLAYGYKGAGFAVLLCLALLDRLDRTHVLTARMLGASGPRIFWRIAVPHMAPALNTSFIILFLYAFGAFDIPYLLSESHPGMLSITVYDLYFQRGLDRRPEAMAMLVGMLAFSAAFIWAYTRAAARWRGRGRKL